MKNIIVFQQVWRWNQQTCSCRERVCASEEGTNSLYLCETINKTMYSILAVSCSNSSTLAHPFLSRMLMLPIWTRWNLKPRLMLSRMRSTSSGPSTRQYVIFIFSLTVSRSSVLMCSLTTTHFICRNSVSCRARSRTPLLLWRWTTAATWTWMPLWLMSVLSMMKLLTATGPMLSYGTKRRCVRIRPQRHPVSYIPTCRIWPNNLSFLQ